MPSIPPFSRSEKIEDYAAICRPVMWRVERIKAADGTKLALSVGEIPGTKQDRDEETENVPRRRRRVVIVYFQGYVLAAFILSTCCLACSVPIVRGYQVEKLWHPSIAIFFDRYLSSCNESFKPMPNAWLSRNLLIAPL